jgi:hypothetical protein
MRGLGLRFSVQCVRNEHNGGRAPAQAMTTAFAQVNGLDAMGGEDCTRLLFGHR